MKKLQLLSLILFVCASTYIKAQVKEMFQREGEYQRFSGSAIVINEGGELFRQSYGWADYSCKKKNRIDLPSDIGSVSKQFTAAAILHLVQQGKVDLEGKINQYLPDRLSSENWEDVTVHHLLTHSSGIPSLFQGGQGIEIVLPEERATSNDELVSIFKDADMLFDPGEEYRYNNSGYLLLAIIIESISGKTYGDFMKETLFDRYCLNHTSFGPEEEYAMPQYNYREDLVEAAPLYHKSWMKGAGGIYSTVGDLSKWIEVIRSEQFLTPELRNKFLTGHKKKKDGYYGYGWDVMEKHGTTIIEHSGVNFGYVSYLGFDQSKDNVVIITTNQTYPQMEKLGNSESYILGLAENTWKIFGGEEVSLPAPITNDRVVAGTYIFEDGFKLTISGSDTAYRVSGSGEYSPTRLAYQSELKDSGVRVQALKKVAEHLKKDKYWGMASVMDGQMKLAVYTGLFSWGFGQVTEGLGTIIKASAVEIRERTGIIRLTGENAILDVIVYFNEEDKIQGVFENGWYDEFDKKEIVAYPVENNTLYMDGFPYGETSATLKLAGEELIYEALGRHFIGKRQVAQNN